jgi:hypothetical protein
MKNLIKKPLILFTPLIIFACSGSVLIDFYGKIIGGNPNTEYTFQFLENGQNFKDSLITTDDSNNYKLSLQFKNTPPQCISLLIDSTIHDRYCIDNNVNYRDDEQYLNNVFTRERIPVSNLYKWNSVINVKNLNFSKDNYLKNEMVLKFDDVDFNVNNSPDGINFDFQILDSSNSIDSITVYCRDSPWQNKKVDLIKNKFQIAKSDLFGKKELSTVNISLRIYSKFGWYKDVEKYL